MSDPHPEPAPVGPDEAARRDPTTQGPPAAAATAAGHGPPAPGVPAIDRVYAAWQRRTETDYLFDFWSALGWTVLTVGVFGFYVLFQLVRRLRDHNARRLELLEASVAFAWEQSCRRGLDAELTPSFERAAGHLATMRRLDADRRDPVAWLVLSALTGWLLSILAFVVMDQDLIAHDRAEAGVEYELWTIFGRLGCPVPGPDVRRVKGPDRYALRIVALVATAGLYGLWWLHDQMAVPDRHFRANWYHEDVLAAAVQALR